jgi:hypothetical protein
MLNLEKDEYNDLTFLFIQALLFKITDSLLSITCSARPNELDVNAYFDADKMSDLDKKLMVGFETEIKDRLPAYEIRLSINEVSASAFHKNPPDLSNVLFLRFNKL